MYVKFFPICVGLFGTCGNSTWRERFMTRYKEEQVDYFNPQVADWKPEDAAIEAEHLVNDDIILFPVTGETYGTGSLAETGFSIMQAIRSTTESTRFVVVYIEPLPADHLREGAEGPTAHKESARARALVLAHLKKVKHPNVFLVNSLDEMLRVSLDLIKVQAIMKALRASL